MASQILLRSLQTATDPPIYTKPVLDKSEAVNMDETEHVYRATASSYSNILSFSTDSILQGEVSVPMPKWTHHQYKAIGKPEIEQVLSELAAECAVDNWDGYSGKRIDDETINAARVVLNSLPYYVSFPDIAGEPGGEIGFEWRRGDAIVAVMIDKRFRLHYAAICGRTTERGAVDFVDQFPNRLASLIALIAQ